MTSPDAGHWQIQEAKQRFSEMIRAVTSEGPQVITRHGEDVAVVVDIAEYRRLTRPTVDLAGILPGGRSSTTVPRMFSRRSRPSAKPTSAARPISRRPSDVPARDQCAVGDAEAPPGSGRGQLDRGHASGPPARVRADAGEIGRGIARVRARGDRSQASALDQWLHDVGAGFEDRILPVTLRVAAAWGGQEPAQPLPVIDALIAATARVYDLTVVTRNVKDFEPVPVRVFNPFAE